MSYVLHVVLDIGLVYITPRVTSSSVRSPSPKRWEWERVIAYCLVVWATVEVKHEKGTHTRACRMLHLDN